MDFGVCQKRDENGNLIYENGNLIYYLQIALQSNFYPCLSTEEHYCDTKEAESHQAEPRKCQGSPCEHECVAVQW